MAKGGKGSFIRYFDGMIGFLSLTADDYTDETRQVFEDYAARIQSYAQQNAPWTDRTGLARVGLSTDVWEENGEIVLSLYHLVDYGEWLETIQSGNYAIIMPTLEAFAPEVFEAAGGHIVSEEGGDL